MDSSEDEELLQLAMGSEVQASLQAVPQSPIDQDRPNPLVSRQTKRHRYHSANCITICISTPSNIYR